MRPFFAGALTEEERETLPRELKSDQGLIVRRNHVILMSADDGLIAQVVVERVGYRGETARKVIRKFNKFGLLAI